ncbi:MAG: hypothetical protein LKE40_06150 [Spirochaetia bacterium]|jgi:hypothetical protein|nr:hypothetical protein [Spirochaetia bacterium]
MAKVIMVESADTGKVLTMLEEGKKTAVIDFSGSAATGNTSCRRYAAGDGIKAYEQLKRWVSSGAFAQIAVVDGAKELEHDKFIDWIIDHKTKDDFPDLFISGTTVGEKMKKVADRIIK